MLMSAELQRKLDNIIRFGVIAEVNHATARARVKSGDILTEFLPFITFRASTTKHGRLLRWANNV